MKPSSSRKNITFSPKPTDSPSHQWRQAVIPQHRGRPPKTMEARAADMHEQLRRRAVRWANEDIHRDRNVDPLFQ